MAFAAGTSEGYLQAQSLFFHFLARLSAFYNEKKDARVIRALEYMSSHLDDSYLSVEEVAAHVYVSSVFLRRLFREQVGCTPMTKLTQLRLNAAKKLLIQSDIPIGEISIRCGFTEAKYFSQVFHSHIGVAPSIYRTMHR